MDVFQQKPEKRPKEKPLSLKKAAPKQKTLEICEESSPHSNEKKAAFEPNLSNISFESNNLNNTSDNPSTATNKPSKPKVAQNKQMGGNPQGTSANTGSLSNNANVNAGKLAKNCLTPKNAKNSINSPTA